jgi:hypothetical protein
MNATALAPATLVSGLPARAGTVVSITRSAGYIADIFVSCSITEQPNDPPTCAPPNRALTPNNREAVVEISTKATTPPGTYHLVVRASDTNGLTASNGDQTVSFTLSPGGAPITYSEVISGASGRLGSDTFGKAGHSATVTLRSSAVTNGVQPWNAPASGYSGVANYQGSVTVAITSLDNGSPAFATIQDNQLEVETSPGSWVGFGKQSGPSPTFPGFMWYPYVLSFAAPPGTLPDLTSSQSFSSPQMISCGIFMLGTGCPAFFQLPIPTDRGDLVFDANPAGSTAVNGSFCSQLGSFTLTLAGPGPGPGALGPFDIPVMVTSTNMYAGPVTLSCAATAVTCTPTPSSVQVSPTLAGIAKVTLGVTPNMNTLIAYTVTGTGTCNVAGTNANGALQVAPAANAGGGWTALITLLSLIAAWILRHLWRTRTLAQTTRPNSHGPQSAAH